MVSTGLNPAATKAFYDALRLSRPGGSATGDGIWPGLLLVFVAQNFSSHKLDWMLWHYTYYNYNILWITWTIYMEVSWNGATPNSSIWIRFSIPSQPILAIFGSGDEIHVVYIRPYLEPHSKEPQWPWNRKKCVEMSISGSRDFKRCQYFADFVIKCN